MSDCPNVEIRELLPDYLGGKLSDVRRSEVSSHLASCQECAEELALLQLVRQAYEATTPAVNVSAIVGALPRKAVRPVIRSWRRGHAFQIAAAVSFIALGGISLAVARSFFTVSPDSAQVDSIVAVNTETPI